MIEWPVSQTRQICQGATPADLVPKIATNPKRQVAKSCHVWIPGRRLLESMDYKVSLLVGE
jgi:hypothetical protein